MTRELVVRETEADRNSKRLALATLFATCRGGVQASKKTASYIGACQRVPVAFFVGACKQLGESWDDSKFGAPQPGDIKKAARALYHNARMRQNVTDREAEHQAAKAVALTPDRARAWLETPEAEEQRTEKPLSLYQGMRRLAGYAPKLRPQDEAQRRESG